MGKECVFCNFDREYVLEENGRAFAAYFDCAIKPGHVVVALKEHVTGLGEMTEEQAADLMKLAAAVAGKAKRLTGCMKYYLVSIADVTPHYHVHLLPRMEGETAIGEHIMGENGWKGEAGSRVEESEIREFIRRYKEEKR